MRLTRPRFTVRRLMLAVAVLACLMAFALRPYPTTILGLGPACAIYWSDGSHTVVLYGKGTTFSQRRNYGPVMRVDWSDGSTSWYLVPWMPRWDRQAGSR
jgi:hypothetical protein